MCCEKSALSLSLHDFPGEGKDESSEVASSTQAANHYVWLLIDLVELFHSLQSDDGLMDQNVVEDAAETVGVAWVFLRVFQSLGNCDS